MATDQVDPSWQRALGELLKSRAQAGVDYVFSYGPLGSLLFSPYDAELFWLKYAWEIGIGLISVLLLSQVVERFGHRGSGCLFYLAVLVFLVQTEAMITVCLVVTALLWIDVGKESRAILALSAIYVGLMGLAKFTFLALGGVLVVLATACLVIRRAYARAAAFAGLSSAAWLAGWMATGQSPANIPAYVSGSAEITSGYSAAMGSAGNSVEFVLALAVLATVAAAVVPTLARPRLCGLQIVSILIIALALIWSFKHGFTRHNLHAVIFFRYALFVPFLVFAFAAPRDRRAVRARSLWIGAGGLAAVGALAVLLSFANPRHVALQAPRAVKSGLTGLLRPDLLRDKLEDRLEQAGRDFALPAIRAHAGQGSVDLFSADQGVVFLNGLRWNPRPVFQSYTAYTDRLLRINAAHFEGPGAPDHLLLNLKPLDGRPLAHEDSAALLRILETYEPVLTEGSYALLDRIEDAVAPRREGREILNRAVEWDEEIRLPVLDDGFQTVALDIDLSPWGHARATLLRPPAVLMQVVIDDGRTETHRIVPGMARTGFLINPHCNTQDCLLDLFTGSGNPPRAVSLRLSTDGSKRAFRPLVNVTVRGHRPPGFQERGAEEAAAPSPAGGG